MSEKISLDSSVQTNLISKQIILIVSYPLRVVSSLPNTTLAVGNNQQQPNLQKMKINTITIFGTTL